jgi:hypothetical protein
VVACGKHALSQLFYSICPKSVLMNSYVSSEETVWETRAFSLQILTDLAARHQHLCSHLRADGPKRALEPL